MSRPKQSTRKPPQNWETPIAQDIKRLEQIPPRTGREHLSRLEKLAMLDGIHHGLTDDQISAEHKMSTSTIQRFKRGLYDDPSSLFDMRVIGVDMGIYHCRVCGELQNKLYQAQRHLLGHFFAPEVAQNIDLNDLPEVF
jgi:hypothetical protein